MNIILNGLNSKIQEPTTIERLLDDLGIDNKKVAVERNLEIVPKSEYKNIALKDGDKLEIVHFIGGGLPDRGGKIKKDGSRFQLGSDMLEVAGRRFSSRLLVGTSSLSSWCPGR